MGHKLIKIALDCMKSLYLLTSTCFEHLRWSNNFNVIITISLMCTCAHTVSYSIMVYETNYTFSLCQHWEDSPVGGYSFDCIKSMVKFFALHKLSHRAQC